jgi:FMN phosphatase YigB (HAD superfamily)
MNSADVAFSETQRTRIYHYLFGLGNRGVRDCGDWDGGVLYARNEQKRSRFHSFTEIGHCLLKDLKMIKIKACFIDIDATITDDGDVEQILPEYPVNNALIGVLRDVMVCAGWDKKEAVDALTTYADDVVFWDYQSFIDEFNIPAKEAWSQIIKWHDDHLIVYEDAVSMIKRLHAMDVPLYVISNNPIQGCLLKLQRAGLGTMDGSPWFKDIFGSNKLKGQKSSVEFWERALACTDILPEDIVVIGDNLKDDFQIPSQAGVKHFFQVDRKRKEPFVCEDGACFVNSLQQVPDYIELNKDI